MQSSLPRPAKGGTVLPRQPVLTVDEQKLNDVWNEHLRAEFNAHSADETVATMVANPLINEVPVMIGGDGKEEVYRFYAKYFLPKIPPDFEIVPVSRTIGQGRLVDEVVIRLFGAPYERDIDPLPGRLDARQHPIH